nr:arginase family protein [Pseudobdellovibrionaceae bacterium]
YKNEALIINLDSHLDVRPMTEVPHSGTPFFRMLKEFSKEVSFFEVGIQNHCNSAAHLAWAHEHLAHVIFQNELLNPDDLNRLFSKLPPAVLPNNKKLKVFISLDIDAFSNSEAPGCSQSWATGLSLIFCLELFKHLQKNYDVRGLGIYEVSPPLDFDHKTSKLAALIMHHFIYGFIKK